MTSVVTIVFYDGLRNVVPCLLMTSPKSEEPINRLLEAAGYKL